MRFQIDYNRAIGAPFADRPVVDADYGSSGSVREWNRPDILDQSIPSNGHAEQAGETGAAIAAKRNPKLLVRCGEAIGASTTGWHDRWQAFRENSLGTGSLITEEAAGAYDDADLDASQGHIRQ